MKTEEIKSLYLKHRLGITHQWDSEKIKDKPMPKWFYEAMQEYASQFYTKEQVVELLDDLKKELYKDIDFHSFNSNHAEERGIREAVVRITNIIIHINTNDKIK